MILKYKKKKTQFNLIFGLIWLLWFFIGYLTKEKISWTDYGWIIISLLYLSLYFYQKKKQYGQIINDKIIINDVFKKTKEIDLKKVNNFKKSAGYYIFKSENAELKINIELIDQNSLRQLNKIVENYKLKTQ